MTRSEIRVLLVDDAKDARKQHRAQLAGGGIAIVGECGLESGATALAREAKPDLVVVGFEEPLDTALATIQELAAARPEAAIIAVSSLSDLRYARLALKAGAEDYLVKPVAGDDLRQAVQEVLKRRQKPVASQDTAPGKIVTVFGSKGGIGKTALAVNLAAGLAAAGRRVALIDLDIQFGDVAMMMDLVPQRTIVDAIRAGERLDRDYLQSCLTRHAAGVAVLAAPVRPEEGEEVTDRHVAAILQLAAKSFEFVVVDAPRSFQSTVLAALDAADLVLLLTSVEVTAIKSAKICLDTLRRCGYTGDKLKLVVTHSQGAGLGAGDVESTIDYPVYWKVPADPAVGEAIRQGKVLAQTDPKARLSQNVFSLAQALAGTRKEASQRPKFGLGGLLKRPAGAA